MQTDFRALKIERERERETRKSIRNGKKPPNSTHTFKTK